jgi:HipA-like C-terminal domain
MGDPRAKRPETLAEVVFRVQVDTALKIGNLIMESRTSALTPRAQPDSSDLRWDLFNLALGNRDNHGRNAAVLKDTDGTMALAPIYDFGPAFLDARAIARVVRWEGEAPGGGEWSRVLDLLDIRFEEAGLAPPREPLVQTLCETAVVFETLPQLMRQCGVDEAISAQRQDDIVRLSNGLRAVGGRP